jgi:hypothetical protein
MRNQLRLTIDLRVRHAEIGELASAINEVLNGFTVPDFDRRVGVRVDVERLLRHLGDIHRASSEDQDVLLKLDVAQSHILINALNEVLNEFDIGEFETRMGFTQLHARNLLKRLVKSQA